MKKLRIGKIIDQFGWAFYFVAKEMAKYSAHTITYEKYNNVHYDNLDIILLSNPNISAPISTIQIPTVAKERNLKVIGQYCGEVQEMYKYADLIIAISPQTYNFAKSKYTCPVIYLPESIDTDFFKVKEFNPNTFTVGWAGREHVIKRTYLLSKLAYPVKKQANWGGIYFTEKANSQPMLDFYHSIDCLVLTSASECQPRVVMEAMSCGIPVISTNVGSIPMLLDKEWVVPVIPEAKVIEEMNKKLKLLAENPELRKNVGKRNRTYIYKKFSWELNQKYWDEIFVALYNNDNTRIMEIHNSFVKKYWREFSTKPKYLYDRVSNTFNKRIENIKPIPAIKEDKKLILESPVSFLTEEPKANIVLNKEKNNIRFISSFTIGTVYEKIKNDYLLPGLIRWNLPYHVFAKPNLGNWAINSRQRPLYIKEAMKMFPNENIVWIDIDAKILKYPELLFRIPETYDIGINYLKWEEHYGRPEDKNKNEILDGTSYYKNSPSMLLFIDEWIERSVKVDKNHRYILEQMIDEQKNKLNIFLIPKEYCYITTKPDGTQPSIPLKDPTIAHYQSSRQARINL
jgi:glycosyltransferase involved in cell wall biosynthesis